jgi:methionine sulfoxide reductase heme-binding subunit
MAGRDIWQEGVMILAATSKSDWFLMRGTGLVTLLLFTFAVALGIAGAARPRSSRSARVVTSGMHRNLALLAVCFLTVHVVTAVLDSFVHLSWFDVILPFASAYRPVWLGLGVLSVDLTIAIVATSLLRRHLGYRLWRFVHWAAVAAWPLAIAHSLGAGSDTGSGWGLGLCATCIGIVALALAWRVASRSPAASGSFTGAPALSTVTTTNETRTSR